MNDSQKKKFKELVIRRKQELLQLRIKVKINPSIEEKESNYRAIVECLQQLDYKTQEADVRDGLTIFKEVLGRADIEIQKPPPDTGAAQKLAALEAGSSEVKSVIAGVDVRLDNDQLKHQPQNASIGTRIKGGGNRFVGRCDAEWHRANTLVHMATWANGLHGMKDGEQRFHGQATPVNDIHYEGFYLLAGGKKYVLFHCYPADNSPLKQ
jgi:hypothetical protein